MSTKISILIPVYRESELLKPLIDYLLADPYDCKEIFVIVDEPTSRSLRIAENFADKVRFIWNGKRKGKANVLNEVVKDVTGEILLFIDADVLIDHKSKNFLEAVSEGMREAEIIEVKKDVIRDSFLARIVSYDYLGLNFTSWFFSRRLRKCLGINGAAFAIKKETFIKLGGFRRVISEDLDMGTRAFLNGVEYKFLHEVTVCTKAPSSLREWFKQRKRWGIGSALWLKEYFRDLLKIAQEHPGVLLPSLLFIFPFLPLLVANLLTPDELYVKLLYVSLIFLSTQASILLPPMAITSTTLSMFRNLLLMVCSLGVYLSFFYLIARKIGYMFNPLEFAFFYLVYCPLWFLIVVASITRVYFRPKNVSVDWKI